MLGHFLLLTRMGRLSDVGQDAGDGARYLYCYLLCRLSGSSVDSVHAFDVSLTFRASAFCREGSFERCRS